MSATSVYEQDQKSEHYWNSLLNSLEILRHYEKERTHYYFVNVNLLPKFADSKADPYIQDIV